ncbi:MAG: response regulator [Chryseobacterium sp.]|nr:MAG: response regulator [Chryseobacterium sp.]
MNSRKILIFDDDATILEVLGIIFDEAGYEVKISETSHDILEKVSAFRPDVILMDNWIPDIGGVEATRLLKSSEEFSNVPVIYITANNDIAALAEEAGADDYVAKPFDIDELETKVAALTGQGGE